MLSVKMFWDIPTPTNLNIFLGHLPDEFYIVDNLFNQAFDVKWLSDELVRDIITDLCNATDISTDGIIRCPDWYDDSREYVMSYRELSSGVKAVLLLYTTDFQFVCLSRAGDNCAKWVLEVAKRKRIYATLNSYMDFKGDFDACILNEMDIIHGERAMLGRYLRYFEWKYPPCEAIPWLRQKGFDVTDELKITDEVWLENEESWYEYLTSRQRSMKGK